MKPVCNYKFELMMLSLGSDGSEEGRDRLDSHSMNKMQLEIMSLQNKIKGLENKLSPYTIQRINEQAQCNENKLLYTNSNPQ